ncbi:MAG: MobF family relaxase [Nocardioides sp.]
MSLHKLSAGSGYEYLTRQVAALDSTGKGATPLADYYSAKGESPGRWVGSGLAGIDGLEADDVVTAEQMKLLFGAGQDPVSGVALGRRNAVYRKDGVDGFDAEVARRMEATPHRAAAEIRSEVGREFFVRRHSRAPRDARELASAVARFSRPQQSAVSGWDLTFSPVKSVSTLWAVAPREVAEVIEAAHDAAVADALAFVEREVLFTREGKDGARQVETRGLIGAVFIHRDSRAGDPDLHTHVAVANKVQTRQGKWLAIYGKLLCEQAVSVSETYNTALEKHLGERLGLRFAERSSAPGRRGVREIVGVDQRLCETWSARRTAIVTRQQELARQFQAAQGRPPTREEEYALAQQANLETRAAKHEPRSLAEHRKTWRTEAIDVLGSDAAVAQMVHAALQPQPVAQQQVSTQWVRATAEQVVAEVESRRAAWQVWHVRAEAQRQIRDAAIPTHRVGEVAEWIVDEVTNRLSVNLTPELDPISEPTALRRSDGTSVYRHTGRDRYTSHRVLDAEQRILTAAGSTGAPTWSPQHVELALLAARLAGTELNAGQERLIQELATSGRRVQLALAPAGSGKTTAMKVLTDVWREAHVDAVGLAPSAAAAAALAGATGMRCDTLAKLIHDLAHDSDSELVATIGEGTLVVIDEAGMADTLSLATVVDHAVARGAVVRLIGDDKQLAAVGAGGVLRDIAARHGDVRLDEVVRFSDATEADASLLLREGDRAALGYYLDHDRIHVGDTATNLDAVLAAWQEERSVGHDCVMLAPTRDLVRELNQRARDVIRGEDRPTDEVRLADGNAASVGDIVLSRRNDRRLGVSGTDWVKNGDRWTVTGIEHGTLRVRHTVSGLHTTLPADYVAAHVELGYASTVHTAQGLTADVMHGIVTGEESRQVLYTMMTRGRHANHVHVVMSTDADGEQPALPGIVEELTATETLERILARDGAAISATTTATQAASAAERLRDAALRYADALALAAQRLRIPDDDPAGEGPLPWLAGIPEVLAAHPTWHRYLSARARLVDELAGEVRAGVANETPSWATRYGDILTPDLLAETAVWRAATGVSNDERTVTGPPAHGDAEATYQRRLLSRLNSRYGEVLAPWEQRIIDAVGRRDGRTIELAKTLEHLSRRGIDAQHVLHRAVIARPLPDDHPTAALEFRVAKLVKPSQAKSRTRPSRHKGIEAPRRPDPPSAAPGIGL